MVSFDPSASPISSLSTPSLSTSSLSTSSLSTSSLSTSWIQEDDPCSASQVMVGSSAAMSTLWARIQRVAPYFRTALLTGEAGSGQQAVARALHQLSPLSARPFSVLHEAEAERRLARLSPPGSFEDGMLYLPEPDKLSHAAQASLLRLLRERGAQAPRLVTFAERGLRSLISACNFSPDLANSLGALQIEVPPLRERADDLPTLANFFLRLQAEDLQVPVPALAREFLEAAAAAPWPGNLEQLQTTLRWLLVQGSPDILQAADLDMALAALTQTTASAVPEARLVRLDQIVREQVRAVLMACNGNKLRAAEILGISRSTLYRMLGAAGSSDSSLLRG